VYLLFDFNKEDSFKLNEIYIPSYLSGKEFIEISLNLRCSIIN